jgi:Asp-tRNA(Asn)/Glu-tRNA(Gln) amidotransferase C subunit
MIDEKFVAQAAALAGIEIPAGRMREVMANLQRTAQIAATLEEVELDPAADELGPVWRP